ncbi:glycosyltransferase family 2 protein, partial [Alphaproteobacteria bacterium]|nr:glycosyltransferase family 2 protein [Alphaproteobacteria bacterium]
MPKISVYIVSHNYGRYVEEAINSVLYQSIDDWELLLFDDGSSDNTYEILAKFENYCRVRVFRTEGLGLQKICNIAVKEARGKYIIRLDGDDVFEPDILLVLSNHLDRNPKVGLVFPDYYLCS